MTEKNEKYNNSNFDEGPEEPIISAFFGYDDCETCYFRMSTVQRITHDVEQLRREAL